MTVRDGDRLGPALADAKAGGAAPAVLPGDSRYGSNDSVKQAAGEGVGVVSPSMPAKGSKQQKLTLEQFTLDAEGRVVRCPAGHAPVSASVAGTKLQARFDPAVCAACPPRQQCLTERSVERGEGRRFQYPADRVKQRARRLADQSDAFEAWYRWRAGIEGTVSRLKHRMHLARLRVRGLAAVTHRVFPRTLGLNIFRYAAAAVA